MHHSSEKVWEVGQAGWPFLGGKLPGSLKAGGDLADDGRDYVRMEADGF